MSDNAVVTEESQPKVLLRCERGGYALVNKSDQEAHVVVKFSDHTFWSPPPLQAGERVFFDAPPGTVVAVATFTDGTVDGVRQDCSVPQTTTTTEAPTTTVAPTTTAAPTTTVVRRPDPPTKPPPCTDCKVPYVPPTTATAAQPTELAYTGAGVQFTAAGAALCILVGGAILIGRKRPR